MPCKKPKKTWVFLVFHKSLTINFSKKTKKTLSFFNFFKVMTKKKQKKLEENQKKTNMSLRPNILWKVLVFWFSRGFLVFGFPHGFSPKESSNSWLVPLNLEKTKNQKTSRKPKNQKTKTFQRMFGLRLMFGFFWFSSSFFGFFWSWPWKN